MCGICGFVKYDDSNVNANGLSITDLLSRLRHRGYDSWGTICMNRDSSNQLIPHRSNGPVDTVGVNDIATFQLGHTRYTTQGDHTSLDEAQPLISKCGNIALVHNGQVETPVDWSKQSDSLYLLSIIEQEFASLIGFREESHRKTKKLIKQALNRVHSRVSGSYACIILVKHVGMISFRDRHGIRPLSVCFGSKHIAIASESCAFQGIREARFLDVPPGQFIWLSVDGTANVAWTFDSLPNPRLGCLFEFIYLAHNDSVIDGLSVREVRTKLGSLLAPLIQSYPNQIDVIVPIPHTPLLAGQEISRILQIDYVELLQVRSNTSIGPNRTFILPTQSSRVDAVKQKFDIDRSLVDKCAGKSILLIDDSIVRGTTLCHVVSLIREHVKPAKIYVASLAPPIIGPNKFGIDIPSTNELIADYKVAHDQNSELVAEKLGLDGPVIYQTLATIEDHFGPRFETSVFRPPSAVQTRTIGDILGDQF
jgi:amidophosphoribosyltransferase